MEKYRKRSEEIGTRLCVGLDPTLDKIMAQFANTAEPLFLFNKWVIEQTHQYAVAYKPNLAFYEGFGVDGHAQLKKTIDFIRAINPDIFIIGDAKRADIESTNVGYVKAIFDLLGCDAVTLNPYLGREALEPFLEREDKVSIILCRTSNKSAGEFQDIEDKNGQKLWEKVAQNVSTTWNSADNCMLVVGATYPTELQKVRSIVGEMPLLVPGVGPQGGEVGKVLAAGATKTAGDLLINVGRGVIYDANPGEAAARYASEMKG
jgi:orotidine-5'-phosphate decarboxylase